MSMNQIEQLKKILELCERRALAAESRLREALSERRLAEQAHAHALMRVQMEIENQKEERRKNIDELLAAPVEQARLSRIRLQYDVAAEKVTTAQEEAQKKAEEAEEKAAIAEQRRLEHRELEKRRQKISSLIDKLKKTEYEKEPEAVVPSRRF